MHDVLERTIATVAFAAEQEQIGSRDMNELEKNRFTPGVIIFKFKTHTQSNYSFFVLNVFVLNSHPAG